MLQARALQFGSASASALNDSSADQAHNEYGNGALGGFAMRDLLLFFIAIAAFAYLIVHPEQVGLFIAWLRGLAG